MNVWDATPLTPDVQAHREALGLVEFLFSKELVKTQVMENLRGNKSIAEPVRQKALALVEPYWKGLVHQQAVRLVDSLFAKPMLKPDAIDSVRNNHALSEEVRQEALALAEGWPASSGLLNNASWAVACKPGADASAYRLALRQAEEACPGWGQTSGCISTHGVWRSTVSASTSRPWIPCHNATGSMRFNRFNSKTPIRATSHSSR